MESIVERPVGQHISLAAVKQSVDEIVHAVFEARIAQAERVDAAYGDLWKQLYRLYQAGGKRLRPYITAVSFHAYSKQPLRQILSAAAAQELIHLAMLVHDDIIDRDDIRYGVKNITGYYTEKYSKKISDPAERRHFSQSAALLAGDLLISEAYAMINKTDAPADRIAQASEQLARTIFRVIGGELLDTEAPFSSSAAHPLLIASEKTASYSFIGPLLTGAVLAGASKDQQEALAEFGNQLGIAYQLRDDIIGIFGQPEITGKSNDGDIKEGKRTLLSEMVFQRANKKQSQILHEIFGNAHATAQQVEQVRSIIIECGVLQELEDQIAEYEKNLHSNIAALAIEDDQKEILRALVHLCLQRDK